MIRIFLSRNYHTSLLLLPLLAVLSISAQGQEQSAGGAQKTPATPVQEQNQTVSPIGPRLALTPSGEVTLLRAKESFVSLSLKDSELRAEKPLPGGKEETKTFIRELWQLRWRPNDPIDLYVIRPIGVKNPPVVLYLYGFPSDTGRFKDDRYCQRVVQSGVAAVGFVSALTGHRAEYRPPKEWFLSELQESLASSAHDVQMVLNYLDSRGDLDMNRVGLFGQGSGGAIGILAAAADLRLKALDLLDPWGDWPDWLAKTGMVSQSERADYLKTDFLKRLEPLEPVHFLPELKTRHIRIQFVDENGQPGAVVQKLTAAAPSTAKVIHYHDGLLFRNAVADGNLFTWIATELKSQGDTKAESTKVTADTKPAP